MLPILALNLKGAFGILVVCEKVFIPYCILRIMVVWGFLHNNITQKPASDFLYNSLAVAKPKNVFRLTLNPSNKLL